MCVFWLHNSEKEEINFENARKRTNADDEKTSLFGLFSMTVVFVAMNARGSPTNPDGTGSLP
jgi:hypothetical protein